uniref:Secreted protein n=1 Tax=Ciona intestinalis TaxID=7719 RepID=F6SIF6_CIOIN
MKLPVLLVLCAIMPAVVISCEMPREIPPEMIGIDPARWARLRQQQILKGGCRKAGMSQCSMTITVAERLNGTCMILNREPTCVQYTPRYESQNNKSHFYQSPTMHKHDCDVTEKFTQESAAPPREKF